MKNHKTAYILLWFPKPSETFIFREVISLEEMGLPLKIFTLYGKINKGLSLEMQSASEKVERLGIQYLKRAAPDFVYWLVREPRKLFMLFKALINKRWYGFEKTGENLWAFLCALRLARRFTEESIQHIHAPWASGPATAAWVASSLTGIPYSFTARAWDIYPPDGIIREKIRDAVLVRSETRYNIRHLAPFANGNTGKIHLTYNGVPLKAEREALVSMTTPYKFLAVGRFVWKKGYYYLLEACKLLKDSGLDFHLVLAGDGPLKRKLKRESLRLGIQERVSFPGFVTHDLISKFFNEADIFLMPCIVHSSGDRDGIPTVIMESLLHRLPVIASNVSGISELIEDGVTGTLIPEKDPVAVAKAVLDLLKDREHAIKMAEQGRAKILRQFDPLKNNKKILELYGEALAASPQRIRV